MFKCLLLLKRKTIHFSLTIVWWNHPNLINLVYSLRLLDPCKTSDWCLTQADCVVPHKGLMMGMRQAEQRKALHLLWSLNNWRHRSRWCLSRELNLSRNLTRADENTSGDSCWAQIPPFAEEKVGFNSPRYWAEWMRQRQTGVTVHSANIHHF